jgi:hypothetical protein
MTGDLDGDLHGTPWIEGVGVMWRVLGPIFRASLSRGAEEDLGVPTKQNPTCPFLSRKPNPATYGQMAISPYLAESLTILFPDWRRVQGRAFCGSQQPPVSE